MRQVDNLASDTTIVTAQGVPTAEQHIGASVNHSVLEKWGTCRSLLDYCTSQNDESTSGAQKVVSTEKVDAPKNIGVVPFSRPVMEARREIKLQEWEGQVQEIGDRHFTARLVDLTAGETEETEEVDLPIDDLTESDRALLVPGAVFRWIVGYRYNRGEKERFARVVIRRLPVWTDQEIRDADKEAEELHRAIFGDSKERVATSSGT